MKVKSIFCRIGNKYNLADKIIKLIPPHDVYIEPFFGSGSIYFNKEDVNKSVINDLDQSLMNDYKNLKLVSPSLRDYPKIKTIDDLYKILNGKSKKPENKFMRSVIYRCNGFAGQPVDKVIYKNSNPLNKVKNVMYYKNKLNNNTTILSTNYINVIKKYDAYDSFIYLDPPYDDSKGLYSNFEIDYDEMVRVLEQIKGKFLLSINYSQKFVKMFHKFRQRTIINPSNGGTTIGMKRRKELLITNY